MKNAPNASVRYECIKNVLPNRFWQSAVPNKQKKHGQSVHPFSLMVLFFFLGMACLPTENFAQTHVPTVNKSRAKKVKHPKKVTDILHSVKAKEDIEEGDDGAQERLDYEFNRTKDPATNTVPKYRLVNAMQRHAQSVSEQKVRIARSNISTDGAGQGISTNGANAAIGALSWVERGPNVSTGPGNDNNPSIAGRCDALLIDTDPTKPNQAFIGGDNGGLWTCADITLATPAWTYIDNFANISISSICQDPTNPNIMYFGTGNKLGRAIGGGIWKSTDHGKTWSFLTNTTTFYNISKVLCDKHGYLYAGMVQVEKNISNFVNNGLQRSIDGGATWTTITPTVGGINSLQVSDMAYDASHDRMGVYMGYQNVVETQGYCYGTPSTVASSTWSTPVSAAAGLGLFAQTNNNTLRIRQTLLSAKGGIVWALQGYSGGNAAVNGGSYTNLYSSADGGATWTLKNNITSSLFDGGQNWYALAMDCDPQNPSTNVVIGGLNPFKSTDGGTTLNQVARWVNSSTQGGPVAQYVHADIHDIYYNTTSSGLNRVICMDDGGVNISADGGTTWQDRNVGLRTLEFYSVATNPSDPNNYLSGAQDNGSHRFTQSGLGSTYQVSGGDGAFTAIDQLTPNNQVTAYTYNNYYVCTDNGVNLRPSYVGTTINQSGQFINPFDFDGRTKKLYASTIAGSYLRWDDPLTTKNTFPNISVPAISGSVITAITVSPNLNNTIYLAAGQVVVRADNANTASPTFTTITPPTVSAGSNISSIVVGPSTTDQDLIVTSSSYGTNKVFVSTNGGSSWVDITSTLPDMPVNWAAFFPGSNTKVYLATSLGVWYTTQVNGASTVWQADAGIPKVDCRMIKYSDATNTLALATFGRGLWTAKTSTNPKISFYPALLTASKSSGTTTANCRSYFDYSDSLQISDPPTGAATVNLTVQHGGTAILGADFDLTTNGSFTTPSSSIVFNSGTYPNKIPFTVRVYNNKNKNTVLPLTVNLGIAVTGTTDALASTANQNLLINLSDNIIPIPTSTTTNQTIWTEDWETGAVVSSQWVFAPFTASTAVFGVRGEIGCGTNINGNFSAQTFGTNASSSIGFCQGNAPSNNGVAFYRAINGQSSSYAYTNMNVTFNYISKNSSTNNNTLSYSTDGGTTWINIGSQLTGTSTTNVTISLPSVLNNTNFILGWRSVATQGTQLAGFSVDDIVFKADITPPSIETTVSSANNYFVNSGTNIDAFSTNNSIFANIRNVSADLGCVTASIENAGNTWQAYLGGNRSQKTFVITPTTNASGTTYNATFYFTNAELGSLSTSTLRLAKTEASSISASTASNTLAVTPTTIAYNTTGVAFTGSFTGFSRFFLIDQNVVLPIALVSFTGSLVNSNAILNWTVSSEINNHQFDVEVSADGINFVKLGTVLSKGNSSTDVSYSYTHIKPAAGIYYYRLKQIDNDGRFSYTKTIVINIDNGNIAKAMVYPVPAKNLITVNFGTIVQEATINIYSIDMKLLRTENLAQSTVTKDFDISQLPAGSYFLRIITSNKTETLRFVKE